ncbi:MAG: SEC-C domain-containing protein [Syntrophomonadaceae bacterium]|nr:SEC-C domain-containing protein [Syntrophomonadaceae bacterium]
MNKIYSQPSTCKCGSGKLYADCCGYTEECRVILFPWSKKNQYHSLIDMALNDLVNYVKAYFYKYEDAAKIKFLSYANTQEIGNEFNTVFWHWYVLNYRCYEDVSPIIDFYLAEKSEYLEEKYLQVFDSLKNSYLSLYKVKWVKNNTVALQDIWLGHEYIVERSFGSITRLVTEDSLILARLVIIENATLIAGRSVIIPNDQAFYLLEELETIRLNGQIEDRQFFIKEYGEALSSLVIDLINGIKKNRIKAKTLLINKLGQRLLLKQLLAHNFSVIERNKSWLKLNYLRYLGAFNRVYFLNSSVVIIGESIEHIDEMLSYVDLTKFKGDYSYVDGFSFNNEDEAEEVLLEITHDKNLDEWLTSSHPELDNLTPLQAVADVKGRVLLDTLLNKLDLLELRAKSRNEYYISTNVIRTRLRLDKNKLNRELFHPNAIAIKVKKHRLNQELSSFVTAYNWHSEEYRQVGVRAFDWLFIDEPDKLAWMLYMWNEYSSIYHPKVSLPRAVIAALEHIYLELNGEKVKFSVSSKKYGVSSSIISKNTQLFLRHFNEYPLDFNMNIVKYPYWRDFNDYEKIKAYEEVWQHLFLFTYASANNCEQSSNASEESFYAVKNDGQKFWTKEIEKTFNDFYKYYNMLDFQNDNKHTIANLFWENQAKRFPPYLKTAAFNIMMSYVGVYRIYPEGVNRLLFEDYFTGNTYKVYGNFGVEVHENIIPGMLGLTRLLPLGDKLWVNEPMFIVLPDLIELFEKNLQILLEDLHPFDPTDFIYLKKRGEMIIRAHILSMQELEQNAVNLMNQPLQIDWYRAGIINYPLVVSLLKQNRKFNIITENPRMTSFVWTNYNVSQFYQWGYVLVTNEEIIITTPPGKDLDKFIKDIRTALKNEDIVVAFRPLETSFYKLQKIQQRLVQDLAEYFNNNPNLSLALLRQDELPDEELEWQQGIFLLKLGFLLMDYIESIKETNN